jgi:hypothetical protein
MAASFEFDTTRARAALARMARAGDGALAMDGEDWAQGAMAALLDAEFLAAEAGVVPWITLPTGERGLLTVGAARESIAGAPEDVRTIYLATHALVRSTHAQAQPWAGSAPMLRGLGARPSSALALGDPTGGLIIALTVIAIAAIVGTAWYFTRKETIQVEGRNVRTTAIAAEVANLAREQLAQGGKIDPEVWGVFKSIADAETRQTWLPWVLGGALVVGGGAAAWAYWRKKHPEGGASDGSAEGH